jgi:cysteine desulfurase/selenocysteine lyase
VPERFEAGLQGYAGLLGLGAAVDYLSALDFAAIREHEYQLNNYITTEALKLPKFRLIGPVDASKRSGIISFYFEGVDSHQVALMLDEMSGIMIRSGQHCVHSWFNHHKLKGSARVSLAFYNTMAEAQIFIQTLTKISQIF